MTTVSKSFLIADQIQKELEDNFEDVTPDIKTLNTFNASDIDDEFRCHIILMDTPSYPISRKSMRREYIFNIHFAKTCSIEKADVDELVDIVEQIVNYFNNYSFDVTDSIRAAVIKSEAKPIYSHEALNKEGHFESIMELTFRAIEPRVVPIHVPVP